MIDVWVETSDIFCLRFAFFTHISNKTRILSKHVRIKKAKIHKHFYIIYCSKK